MAPLTALTHRTRVLIGVAVAGTIPLTLGVIMWIAGTAMSLASHHGWSQIAGIGLILILAGLACGVALAALTMATQRSHDQRSEAR